VFLYVRTKIRELWHVNAGKRLSIASGGDTKLKGALASANQVVVNVSGNLSIESLQETATLDGKR
jgi:filamentous hemagglutinin